MNTAASIDGQGAGAAERLASFYGAKGMPCEIEGGPVGVNVYASRADHAAVIADSLVASARIRDAGARREGVELVSDEPPATRFVCTVHVSWGLF